MRIGRLLWVEKSEWTRFDILYPGGAGGAQKKGDSLDGMMRTEENQQRE